MAMRKTGGLLSSLGGAMVTPQEMRRQQRDWDFERDRPAQMRASQAEAMMRQRENQLREEFQRDMMRQQPMSQAVADQIRLEYEHRLAREREKMAMAYHDATDTNYFTATSGSGYTVAGSSGTGSPKKKKSNKTNWDRPIIGILQDETDEWLKDALKAA